MKLKYYIEVQDKESKEIIDLYGYDNSVMAWSKGYVKDITTGNLQETIIKIDDIVNKLIKQGCIIINKEIKV
ncbi:hypothetical protein [Paraliobacillus ryukyuensis]|uniref:hypothetical protein n=1 Tax=Paraliobacillus ryukyuensis TaxID=200904 RepID=UPI0009A7790A|nr:hypothetical protein [Paraliobacillus ryukyuensis]